MYIQRYCSIPKVWCIGLTLCISSLLIAQLEVSISQVYPTPPLTSCSDTTGTPVLVGSVVTYAITVTNTGTASVRGFSLTDTLDSDINTGGICFVGVTPICDGTITSSSNSFQINSRQTIAPGDSITFTATFKICTGLNAQGFSTLTNTVTISAADNRDNRVDSGPVTLTSCVQGCALATLIMPGIATNVCQNGSITLTAIVSGCCSPNLSYSWFETNNPVSISTGVSNELVLQASDIPFNGVTYSVTVTDLYTQCSASATSGPLSVIECTNLSIANTACLTKNTVTYTITVSNTGSTPSAVTVSDLLANCLTPVVINSLQGSWSSVQNGNELTLQLTNPALLQPGENASFEIITSIGDGCEGCLYNTATVYGSVFNTNRENSASSQIKLW